MRVNTKCQNGLGEGVNNENWLSQHAAHRALTSHAGINTTLESLALGVPMVAIPVGFDQPGIAARIVYHGVGESVPVASMNTENLSGAMQEVLANPSYRDTARQFQRTIAQTHGLDRAADVLERTFQRVDAPGIVVWEKPLDTHAHSRA